MAGIDGDHVVAALRQIFEGKIARPHVDRRGAHHRDRFHAVEDAAVVIVVVDVVVHFILSWTLMLRSASSRVSKHDATAGPSSFETRFALLRMRVIYLSSHFGS